MASTSSAIQTIIDNIDSQLTVLISDPDDMVSYEQGGVRVQKADKVKYLMLMREYYSGLLLKYPAEDVSHFGWEVDKFGDDAQTEWMEPIE